MYPNEQQELSFLDVITVLSFILQVMNRESHQIAQLKQDVDRKLDWDIKNILNAINYKLDKILEKLT